MHRNDQCCACHPRPKARRLLFARLMPASRSHAQARTLRAMERNGDHLRSADIECRRRARRQPMIQRASARARLIMLGAGAAAGALAGLSPQRATAVLKLDVTSGNVQPIPIAVPEFVSVATQAPAAGRNVSQIIASNLQRSGLFAPIDQAAYIEKILTIDTLPRFADWRQINAQALVT